MKIKLDHIYIVKCKHFDPTPILITKLKNETNRYEADNLVPKRQPAWNTDFEEVKFLEHLGHYNDHPEYFL